MQTSSCEFDPPPPPVGRLVGVKQEVGGQRNPTQEGWGRGGSYFPDRGENTL